jgi:hypothetical protein
MLWCTSTALTLWTMTRSRRGTSDLMDLIERDCTVTVSGKGQGGTECNPFLP